MKITFLGTGGGRFATISQKRMTGGFRIDDFFGKNFHIDPGPGALVRTYEFGLNPKVLDGIFVSHAHTDHYTDSEILIEAMTRGMTREKGIIMCSRSVLEGFKQWGPAISQYHKSKSEHITLGPSISKDLGYMKIKGTKTVHGDPTCVGFQMSKNGFCISYTADTKYFEKLGKYHKGADILICSVIRPGSDTIRGHMCTNNFKRLVEEVNPDLAIMTHFGLKMLNKNPINEAKKVTKDTGIRTLAAFDGMSLDINIEKPSKSKISSLKDSNSRNINSNNSTYQSFFKDNKTKTYKKDFS